MARPRLPEVLFAAATRGAGVFVLTVVVGLAAVLTHEARPALDRAAEFRMFTSAEWTPKPPAPDEDSDPPPPTFGVRAFVYGTAVTSAIAMLLAVPFGVASAAFLSEIAPARVRKIGAFLVELLAAIPSVVYGFWGLFVLAPAVQYGFTAAGGPNTGGNGILAAGVILAVMIVPTITAIGFDVCRAVPRSQREGALALGATRWQTISRVVLPYSRPGLAAASLLALGRALGETMAVTMLIGNQAEIKLSPFALGDTIASRIANNLNEADSAEFRAALVTLALVLMVVTAAFNGLARLLLRWAGPHAPKAREPVPAAGAADDRAVPAEVSGRPTNPGRARRANRVMLALLGAAFAATVGPLFLILGYITVKGAAAVEVGLFTEPGHPAFTADEFDEYRAMQAGDGPGPLDAKGRPVPRGGVGHALMGSVIVVGLATAAAVPVGLLAAVYLAEARRSRLADAVRFAAELLGGVPSIVVGIFGFSLLVYPFWRTDPGFEPWGPSGLAGAATLAVMMLPILVRSCEEALRLVPESLRQASLALGASRVQTTVRVVVPAALPALVTGIFLAVGRIAGETAPLLITAGDTQDWPKIRHPEERTPTLPAYIYRFSRSSSEDEREKAWAATLVLLGVVMAVNVGVRLAAGRRRVDATE